MENHD